MYSPLHLAIESNNEFAANFLIANGASLNNNTNPTKSTPLHLAADRGLVVVINSLLRAGADVNLQDHEARTALHR